MRGLYDRRDASVERNLFVHALLGLSVRVRRTETFLEQLLAPMDTGASVPEAHGREEPAVYALLGAFSLLRRIDSLLADFSREGEQPAFTASEPWRPQHPAEILR